MPPSTIISSKIPKTAFLLRAPSPLLPFLLPPKVQVHSGLAPDDSKGTTTVIADGYRNIVHTPPQQESEIRDLLSDLDNFLNNHSNSIDPLIKSAIIHYQFETIHPFFDGNGRTGRILMILYLVLASKLHFPVLFLSGYILNQKVDYYRLLQEVRETEN